MGSLLAPTTANLFVGHIEELFLENNEIKVHFHVRYVDESLFNIEEDELDTFQRHLYSLFEIIII